MLHSATFIDLPMTRYLLTATAVAFVTVAIIDYFINTCIKSAPFTAPTPGSTLRCQYMKMTTNSLPTSFPKMPPWSSNATIRSGKVLYVWAKDASSHRLGNRLFTYASTYGIAWRTGHLPILPDPGNALQQYDLARYFNLRMPIDHGNRITKVNCYNVLE